MMERIDMAAEEEKAGSEVVTLASLSEVLNSEAWAPLKDSKSVLARLLLSEAFKNAKTCKNDSHIDVKALKCFAFFHSQGEDMEKATAVYNLI
mmetsp:Transcript_8766/g.10368  ORF Transcript_8766/g.10368 Transcript_8766/m.10368 type:complete len:93 (+) Transcript_8766:252-530(+)